MLATLTAPYAAEKHHTWGLVELVVTSFVVFWIMYRLSIWLALGIGLIVLSVEGVRYAHGTEMGRFGTAAILILDSLSQRRNLWRHSGALAQATAAVATRTGTAR